jgi:hypothetical protein
MVINGTVSNPSRNLNRSPQEPNMEHAGERQRGNGAAASSPQKPDRLVAWLAPRCKEIGRRAADRVSQAHSGLTVQPTFRLATARCQLAMK